MLRPAHFVSMFTVMLWRVYILLDPLDTDAKDRSVERIIIPFQREAALLIRFS